MNSLGLPLRLLPDQDLKEQLLLECQKNQVTAGFIVSGIGSLKNLKLRLAQASHTLEKTEPFEILTLQGSISNQGLHVHMSVANSKGEVLGGHLMPGCQIATTAEILIVPCSEYVFERKPDTKTGYQELVITKKRKL